MQTNQSQLFLLLYNLLNFNFYYLWHSYSIFADDTWFSSKTHFTLFFRASRDHKFMYHRKGYFGSETSAWIFGFFKKVLHVLSLSNLVTLGRPTKIKTKKTFSNFSSKTLWPDIVDILWIWTKWRLPSLLESSEVSSEPNFVEKRYKERQWLRD